MKHLKPFNEHHPSHDDFYRPGFDHGTIDVTAPSQAELAKKSSEEKDAKFREISKKVMDAYNTGGIEKARAAYEEVKDEAKKLGSYNSALLTSDSTQRAISNDPRAGMAFITNCEESLNKLIKELEEKEKSKTPEAAPEKKSLIQKFKDFLGKK